MYFFTAYFNGKGLNLTSVNLSKYPSQESYKIPVVPKYDFIAADFEKIFHLECDLINFSRAIKNNGFLIIRQEITHQECYEQIFYYTDLLNKAGSSLIKFESDDTHNYFVFKKQKNADSLFVAAYTQNKDEIQRAVIEIANSKLYKDYFIPLHIYSESELWLDKKFMSELPRFTINCVFSRHQEKGFPNNENAHNWNSCINIAKAKKVLLINDNFKIKDFSFDKKYSDSYIFIQDVTKARKIGGIDFKYETLEWCVYDFAVRMGDVIQEPKHNDNDKKRFESKKSKGLLDNSKRCITIHEALGDNICAFNLLESLKRESNLFVTTAYPFLYDLSRDLRVNTDLHEINGLGFNVYQHGCENKCKTLEYAYFSMNGEAELYEKRRTKYFYAMDDVNKIKAEYAGKKVVLLAPSASNREGPNNGLMLSNKTWKFENWEQIVSYLQSKGYYVIQVGAKEDFKVENVNEYFFNKPFGELVALIVFSKFFMGLDTFFQHLCGLMGKKGIVVTPAHNDHAFWPSTVYIVGKVAENFEHLKWIKDHLNPFRSTCMKSITVDTVKKEVDKIIDCFNKY